MVFKTFAAAIFVIGSMTGAVSGGLIGEKFGRKKSLLFDSMCMILGFSLMSFFDHFGFIMAGRYICGNAAAAFQVVIPAYTCEITQPKIRPQCSQYLIAFFTGGMCISSVMGAMLPWETVASILIIIPAVFAVCVTLFCPESHIWLVTQHRSNEALEVLKSLRGDEEVAKAELARIQQSFDESQREKTDGSFRAALNLAKDKSFMKPFLTLCVMFIFMVEWCGYPTLAFYMVNILQEARIPVDPYWAAAGVSCYRAVYIACVSKFIASRKRRPLFLSTAICHVVILSVIIVYTYLNADGWLIKQSPALGWIPVACLVALYSTSAVGCTATPFYCQGELLPSYARAFGSGLIGLIDNLSLAFLAKLTPTMFKYLDIHLTFAIFLLCFIIGATITWFTLPETHGLTLEEIEAHYRGTNKPKKPRSRINSIVSYEGNSLQYNRN